MVGILPRYLDKDGRNSSIKNKKPFYKEINIILMEIQFDAPFYTKALMVNGIIERGSLNHYLTKLRSMNNRVPLIEKSENVSLQSITVTVE